MKLTTSTLLAAATVQYASALVIPDLNKDTKNPSTQKNEVFDKNDKPSTSNKNIKDQLAPLYVHSAPHAGLDLSPSLNIKPDEDFATSTIKNKYIIIFKDDISIDSISLHKEMIQQAYLQYISSVSNEESSKFLKSLPPHLDVGGIIDSFQIIGSKLNGYIGYFPSYIIDIIRRNPLIKSVEMDSIVTIKDFDTQNNAPWGLARISHRDPLTLGSFNKYLYDDNAGENVDVYVIDTGININHNDFQERAIWGKTIPDNDLDIDGNGHGTHCAGTIASQHYGVAKKANVIAVKVLRSNGSGSMSDVIKGVEFAALSHNRNLTKNGNKKKYKGAAANMSLGGGKSPSLDMVVDAAVNAGIHFAVAAGNENQDACNTSPAASGKAITVGASTLSDDRAYFSNWGSCVDIFAPGLNILSTYIGSNDATATLSGTSMASPHVAGLLAYFLSLQPEKDSQFSSYSQLTPEQLKKKLIDYSTKNVLFDLPEGTPNKLIFNGAGQDLSALWNISTSESSVDSTSSDKTEDTTDQILLHEYSEMGLLSTDTMFEQIRHLFGSMDLF